MGTIHTTWSVRRDHRVAATDRDSEGRIRDDAVTRWVADALDAFLDQCAVLDRLRVSEALERREQTRWLSSPADLDAAPNVLVTATATEVFPTSFVVAVRVRPVSGQDDHPLDARSSVELVDESGTPKALGDAVRDELIALAHAARHYN
jgi:hypothetical protein